MNTKRIRLISSLFCVLSIISISNSCSLIIQKNQEEKIRVDKVIDGDTFKSNNNIYRLLGIDTPETYDSNNNFKPTYGAQYFYGSLAKKFLINFIENKDIFIKIYKKDKHKRIVTRVIVNNQDLSFLLIKNGYAIVRYISNKKNNPFFYPDSKYIEKLYELQNEAKLNKKGFWVENISILKRIYPNYNTNQK